MRISKVSSRLICLAGLASLTAGPSVADIYQLGGPDVALTGSQWSLFGSNMTEFRSAIANPANFGPSGVVSTQIQTTSMSSVNASTLAPLDGFISSYWFDPNTTIAAAQAVIDFFLAGGDLILLNDDSSHDKIAQLLGIPSSGSTGSVSNGGAPLFDGAFGLASDVTQGGSVGRLLNADIANTNGTIAATNTSGQVTAAFWDNGVYAPGSGRMLIVADVDMWSNSGANYNPFNDNGVFALNGVGAIVNNNPIPAPGAWLLGMIGLSAVGWVRRRLV